MSTRGTAPLQKNGGTSRPRKQSRKSPRRKKRPTPKPDALFTLGASQGVSWKRIADVRRDGISPERIREFLVSLPGDGSRSSANVRRFEEWAVERLKSASPIPPISNATPRRAGISDPEPVNALEFTGARAFVTGRSRFLVHRLRSFWLHNANREREDAYFPEASKIDGLRVFRGRLEAGVTKNAQMRWRDLGAFVRWFDDPDYQMIPSTKPRDSVGIQIAATQLDWDPLVPDWWESLPGNPRARLGVNNPMRRTLYERIRVIDRLGGATWYQGSLPASPHYYVADFGHIALAECVDAGNAIYYAKPEDGSWRDLFRTSKRDALQRGARRITHHPGWESEVRRLVQSG